MESIRGVVERITFFNEDNGFSVLKVKVKGFSDLVTVVGTLMHVNVGSMLELTGTWKNDNKYGKQLVVQHYEEFLPATITGIEKYLGSGLIKGVGAIYAKKIVDHFKENTLHIIDHDPDRLLEISGLSQKKVDLIKRAWQDQKEIKNVMIFLQGHGVSTGFAVKIYKTYADESIKVVSQNPYKLADDIWGIGFKIADSIAKKLGIREDSPERIRSGILYTLGELSSNGHCFGKRDALISETAEVLDVQPDYLPPVLNQMIQDKVVIEEDDAIYPLSLFYSEIGVASKIKYIMEEQSKYAGKDILSTIDKVEKDYDISYDPVQREAIKVAIDSKFMVLTGGPGTGKTTTTLGIIRVFTSMGANVLLAAPTGRASKRLSEATGLEAKTVHRLLEFTPQDGYKRNEENPLTGDLLIVDEASMLDILLANHLLKAITSDMCLIFVGDVDQLPSVGPGNVLRDIINSKQVPVVSLERIFRQAQGSKIIVNAHKINKGEMPLLDNDKNGDFFHIEEDNSSQVLETVKELCIKRLPDRYNIDPIEDIQVLCPMHRGELGARNMNEILQNALNKSEEWIKFGGVTYKLGDKVMQIKNNYDKNVFNGDIGRILEIEHEEKSVVIGFDDHVVEYDGTELDEITLAYATSVHKSQGSEYKIVIAPIATQHYMMLQRNLLYTCITRAKQLLILVGTKKAIHMAVENDKIAYRNTMLAKRI
jgi:exodeoxyribonuclease V alpha subunit